MAKSIHTTTTKRSVATETPEVDRGESADLAGSPEAAMSSGQQPAYGSEDSIRAVAHRKWAAAGCPVGDGVEFWLEAEREVHAESSGSSPAQG